MHKSRTSRISLIVLFAALVLMGCDSQNAATEAKIEPDSMKQQDTQQSILSYFGIQKIVAMRILDTPPGALDDDVKEFQVHSPNVLKKAERLLSQLPCNAYNYYSLEPVHIYAIEITGASGKLGGILISGTQLQCWTNSPPLSSESSDKEKEKEKEFIDLIMEICSDLD